VLGGGTYCSAFSLVWHQDPTVKAEMLSAFSNVYLTDGAAEQAEALPCADIANNLIHLVRNCDSAEVHNVLAAMFLSLFQS
jgi:hypothetical protein